MARSIDTLVTQSLLDRLTNTEDEPQSRASSLRTFRDSLKRDLEWLLNTRQPPIEGIEAYPRARASVIHYGLIDTSSLGLASSNDHKKLQQAVSDCIIRYEPRLTNVRIVIAKNEEQRRRMRFHIEAQILLDPAPEPISFDTVLDLTSGEYTVS
ncbi:MAG: type VI secretion system baseplate subunit TssE [Janthinobacterium lividum]